MLTEALRKNLPLYVGHKVVVLLENGERLDGNLKYNRNLEGITLGETFYSFEEIKDVRYLGVITDYHAKGKIAYIDDAFSFIVDADSELYHLIRYKEFSCLVSCHLELEEQQFRMYATNVALEDTPEHVLPEAVLLNHAFLYKCNNGKWIRGVLTKEDGVYELNKCRTIDGKTIAKATEDITMFPRVNDSVVVTTEEQEYSGVISVVRDNGFILVYKNSGYIECVFIVLEEVENICYKGVVTSYDEKNKEGTINERYTFKKQYVSNEEEVIRNSTVSYAIGVNEQGLFAKDIYVENVDAEGTRWHFGIIINPFATENDNREFGAIFSRVKMEMKTVGYVWPNGSESVDNRISQYIQEQELDADKPYFYIAEFSVIDENGNDEIKEIKHIRNIWAYEWERDDVAIELVDTEPVEKGKAPEFRRKKIYQTLTGIDLYRGKEVTVTLQNEEVLLGKVASYKKDSESDYPEVIVLQRGKNRFSDMTEIQINEIKSIRVFGTVTEYWGNDSENSSEEGRIDGTLRFHRDNVRKEDRYYVEQKLGEVSYEIGCGEENTEYAFNIEAHAKEIYLVSYLQDSESGKYWYLEKEDYVFKRFNKLKSMMYDKNMVNLSEEERNALIVESDYHAYITYKKEYGHEDILSAIVVREKEPAIFFAGRIGKYFINYHNGYLHVNTSCVLGACDVEKKVHFLETGIVDNKVLNGGLPDTINNSYDVLFWKDDKGTVNVYVVNEVSVKQKAVKSISKGILSEEDETTGRTVLFNIPENITYVAPALINGETVCYTQNGVWHFEEYCDGVTDLSKERVYRCGIITGFEYVYYETRNKRALKKGYINDMLCFDYDTLEEEAQQLKCMSAEMKKITVLYSCDAEGKVCDVTPFTKEFAEKNDIPYMEAVMDFFENKVEDCEKYAEIKLDDGKRTAKCYFSTHLDGHIRDLASNNMLDGKEVYVKTCRTPMWKKEEILTEVVLEFHYKEAEFPIIESGGKYYGSLHKTHRISIQRDERVLRRLVGKKAIVSFEPSRKEENGVWGLQPVVKASLNRADISGVYVDDAYEWLCDAVQEQEEEFNVRMNQIDAWIDSFTAGLEKYPVIRDRILIAETKNRQDLITAIKMTMVYARQKRIEMYRRVKELKLSGTQTVRDVLRDIEVKYQSIFYLVKPKELRLLGIFENIVTRYEACTKNEDKKLNESLLCSTYKRFQEWMTEAEKYEDTELPKLIMNSVLITELSEALSNSMDGLYDNRVEPCLSVELIDNKAVIGQDKIAFCVMNGDAGKNCHSAFEFDFTVSVMKEGNVIATQSFFMKEIENYNDDKKNHCYVEFLSLPAGCGETEGDTVSVEVAGSYKYEEKRGGELKQIFWKTEKPFLCFFAEDRKNRDADCPFDRDKALREKDSKPVGNRPRMFYGRSTEIKDILEELAKGLEQKGEEGRSVCIWGQKRCGKSSILGRLLKNGKLCNENSEVYENSIVIECDTDKLADAGIDAAVFKTNLYEKIVGELSKAVRKRLEQLVEEICELIEKGYPAEGLLMSLQESEDIEAFVRKNSSLQILSSYLDTDRECVLNTVYRYCTDIGKGGILYDVNPLRLKKRIATLLAIMKDKKEETVDANTVVNTFINCFTEDKLKGANDVFDVLSKLIPLFENNMVIVFMDEFTRYMGILTEKNHYEFINNLKKYGVSFVIAGHERMLHQIQKVNATNIVYGKSKPIPIGELDDDATVDLVSKPMQFVFGNKTEEVPFKSVFGVQVMEYVKEMTGNNPYFITSLCQCVWADYIEKGNKSRYVVLPDVERIVDKMLAASDAESFFDSLLKENDDDVDQKEAALLVKIRYLLKKIAETKEQYKCIYLPEYDIINKMDNLKEDYNVDTIDTLLEQRGVIKTSESDGTIKIKVGLLAKHLGGK